MNRLVKRIATTAVATAVFAGGIAGIAHMQETATPAAPADHGQYVSHESSMRSAERVIDDLESAGIRVTATPAEINRQSIAACYSIPALTNRTRQTRYLESVYADKSEAENIILTEILWYCPSRMDSWMNIRDYGATVIGN